MSIHIGNTIKEVFESSGIKPGIFCKQINTGRRNLYSIFNRKDISAELLFKISIILKHDFFAYYQKTLNKEMILSVAKKEVSKVVVSFEMDGTDSNLIESISKLRKISKAIKE
jgi:hypothetical protein